MQRLFKLALVGLIIIIITGIVSGCWDRIEIDKRLFVFGIAIDEPKSVQKKIEELEKRMKKELKQKGNEEPTLSEVEAKLAELEDPSFEEIIERTERRSKGQVRLTIEAPIVRNLAGSDGGSGGGEPSWSPATIASSPFEALRQLTTRINRRVYLGHLKAIIFHEKLARRGIQGLLDFFERDNEVQRRVKIFVSKKSAKHILIRKIPVEQVTSTYLTGILKNKIETSRLADIDIGQLMINMHTNAGSLVPRVRDGGTDLKVAGSAVFRGDKMVGWLGEVETRAALWVRGDVQGGDVVVQDPEEPGKETTYEIRNAQTMIKSRVKAGKLIFEVQIGTEGNIAEVGSDTNAMNDKYIKAIEENVEEHIEGRARDVIKKAQQEFQTDFFGFGEQLRRHQPQYWKKVKESWHQEFADAQVIIKAEVNIRRIGLVK
ncbi:MULTISPECIES: Ger(x)C family spore germination protein [unclassified Candidatus Frackibacter]|uniref:Ger(x)C family spore germination protein n=1 Tax=unclassified Candidatus Frackibacter TaxID=2648818 RepID=UPI0008924158|nr:MULTISPECIES: Ger(x)C family spore germination protein [unclassified Candidatus Frackibacter]SDC77817.1 spore germination protein KC [Candidatus Frackibacter sp. WG11]SEM90773.1 spore germination protein KC [Candidatus Frackibacter sp. WG12]SFL99892.1 spore germination protein KC [Candidatus Frackibacter sp. WG13]